MQFPFLFTSQGGLGTGLSNLGIAAVIAALACLLCTEIVCIAILIGKMRRMSKEKQIKEETEEEDSSFRHYGAAFIGLSAIPQVSFIAITCLAWLTAVGALVFAVLLAVCRIKGYDFAVVKRKPSKEEEATATEEAVTYDTEESLEEVVEEPLEDADADYAAASVHEESPLAVFDVVGEPEEPVAEETVEEAVEEVVAEETAEESVAEIVTEEVVEETVEEPIEESAEEPLVPTIIAEEEVTAEETVAEKAPEAEVLPPVVPAAEVAPAPVAQNTVPDADKPYKVVEKVVTETYKEVVRETPVAVPAQQSSAADAVLNKLSDFLDYELQKRKEADQAEAEAREQANEEPIAVIAPALDAEESDEEDELDEDDDAIDADDSLDEDDEDEDDADVNSELFTGNERIVGFDEETGCYLVAHYRKSFEAKLIQARPHIKKYYSELKNALLSYSDTKNRISWAAETFQNNRQTIAKINVRNKQLELYLALDPDTLDESVYHGKNVGHKKKYADTPFLYKVRSSRKFQWAMELVQRVCEEHGLSPIDIDLVDYVEQYAFDTTENLVARGLIREYIRQEKPATTFELDPDHVPEVPEEDGSVIPANANFSWEFDNDAMEDKHQQEEAAALAAQEEKVEEQTEEKATVETFTEEVASEESAAREAAPVFEPAPVQPVETVRETVKVTEMRYTERYYPNADATFEEVITTSDSAAPIVAPEEKDDAQLEMPFVTEEALAMEASNPSEQSETVIVVEPKRASVAETVEEEPPFFADEKNAPVFSADKFEGADPFADFRGEEEPVIEEEPIIEESSDVEETLTLEDSGDEVTDEVENAVTEESEEEEPIFFGEDLSSVDEDAELVESDASIPAFVNAEDDVDTEDVEVFEEEWIGSEQTDYAQEDDADLVEDAELVDESDDGYEYFEDEDSEEYFNGEYAAEDEEEVFEDEEFFQGEDGDYDSEEQSFEEDWEDEEEGDLGAYAEDFDYGSSKGTPSNEPSEYFAPQSSRPAPASNSSMIVLDLYAVEEYFEDGSEIDLEILKDMGVVPSNAAALKVRCTGALSKQFTVNANVFTEDAIRAINAVGGTMNYVR